MYHHCADREDNLENYWQVLTHTYSRMCTLATKLMHLLPVGPILPSTVRIQGAKQKHNLKTLQYSKS